MAALLTPYEFVAAVEELQQMVHKGFMQQVSL